MDPEDPQLIFCDEPFAHDSPPFGAETVTVGVTVVDEPPPPPPPAFVVADIAEDATDSPLAFKAEIL